MSDLVNFPTAKQKYDKSCWACASRMIINFYTKATTYDSDTAFATAYGKTANSYQSAAAALAAFGYSNAADGSAIPTLAEIEDAIKTDGTPLLSCVGQGQPIINQGKIKRDLNFQNGHWVVIVGVDVAKKELHVFDPDSGIIETVAYGALFKNGQYWKNTSYVDKAPIKK